MWPSITEGVTRATKSFFEAIKAFIEERVAAVKTLAEEAKTASAEAETVAAAVQHVTTASGNVTIAAGETGYLVVTTGSSNRKVVLPAAPAASQVIHIRGVFSGGHTVTVEGNGKLIEGSATLVLSAEPSAYATVELVWDGTEWRIF